VELETLPFAIPLFVLYLSYLLIISCFGGFCKPPFKIISNVHL
jgi:hypothetical protein